MSQGDRQVSLGQADAPEEYTVPNAVEIIPRAINATFDGTGASGSFLPTVEIVSDGGVVVARVPCQTTVAAGDTAEVTFAPFLRASSAAPTPSTGSNYSAGGDSGSPVGNKTGAWIVPYINFFTGSPLVTLHAAGNGIDVNDYGVFLLGLDLVMNVNPTTITAGIVGSFFVVDSLGAVISTGFDAVNPFEYPDPTPNTYTQYEFHGDLRMDLSHAFTAPFWIRGSFQFHAGVYAVSFVRMALTRIGDTTF